MGTESERRTCLYGLRNACGYLQAQLAERLQMRFTPTLQIVEDTGVKNSLEVSRLINEAMANLPKPNRTGEQPAHSDDADGSASDQKV
jgi:ribosome-binding factor A